MTLAFAFYIGDLHPTGWRACRILPKWRPHWRPENVNHMALSITGPSLVFFEESEPNSPFIALTPLFRMW